MKAMMRGPAGLFPRPLWASLGCCGPPWALVGQALVGWAIVGPLGPFGPGPL